MKYTRWHLTKRMAGYIEKNKKLSPLNNLEYLFMKEVYRYLTKQFQTPEEKKQLYKYYIKLINLCYFPNRSEICHDSVDLVHTQCSILLDREYSGPWTFILLNHSWHWAKMHQFLDLFTIWSLNPLYYGYASEKEFMEVLKFIRKQFNSQQLDLYKEVGKWPRQLRLRKGRK